MPPRRSARIAAGAAPNCGALAALPSALVLAVFSLLPVDARARCAAVCRAWRAALLEPCLWQYLDLSAACGVTRPVTAALMVAAAARARGSLLTLDISDVLVPPAALLAVVAANAALRELRAADHFRDIQAWPVASVEALLTAAPLLRVANTCIACNLAVACRLLRREGQFERLQMRCLCVFDDGGPPASEADVLALAAAVPSHTSLTELLLQDVMLDTVLKLDAVVEAALTHRLRAVWLAQCGLSAASVPALVRLCSSSTLVDLSFDDDATVLPDVLAAVALGNALRANTSLTELAMHNLGMWRDPAVGTALLGALTGHRSLRVLDVSCMHVPAAHEVAAGAALGALIAANAPALQQLDVSYSSLEDAGLGPLVDALPGNTHLLCLDLRVDLLENDGMSEAFARNRLLPAVRANTSLHELRIELDWESAVAAEALVWRREDAD
jgi:hypothetical protein